MEDKSEQDKIKNEQEEKALNQNRKELEQDKIPRNLRQSNIKVAAATLCYKR